MDLSLGNERNLGRPALASLGLIFACVMVWIVALATTPSPLPIWEGRLGGWMVLRGNEFDLRSLLTHHLFHADWIHLGLNCLAIGFAGRFLETRWGALRFTGFYLGAAIAGGLATYLVDLCRQYAVPPGSPVPATLSFGASSGAFACLTGYTLLDGREPVLRWLERRHLVWAGMLVGAAGLLLLEQVTEVAPEHPAPLLLIPHIAGIAAGAVMTCAAPLWERIQGRRGAARHFAREERVLDIRMRVDQLLEKISKDGLESLSREERSFLRDASKHFRNHHR